MDAHAISVIIEIANFSNLFLDKENISHREGEKISRLLFRSRTSLDSKDSVGIATFTKVGR